MNLTWGYGADASNNGNVMSHSIRRGSAAALNQTYQYIDPSNRLSSALETNGWLQTYRYDAFGNRAMPGSYTPNPDQTPAALTEFTVNRWKRGNGDGYDGSGNQTAVASRGNPGVTVGVFTYDGENRMVTSNIANMGTVTYSYDGEGRRVQKSYTCSTGTCTTVFVYDAMGQLAAEYSTAPNPASGTQYLTADSLGSTRLVTDGSGGVAQCYDYFPFGEEIRQGFNGRGSCYPPTGVYPHPADATSMKFTGKERDMETGLDYFGARYMSGAQGRFTTADPLMASGKATNPQTWNRYAHALNNPLRFVDPDGMEVSDACAKDQRCKIVVNLNVMYDTSVKWSDKDKKTLEANYVEKAKKDYGTSNIELKVTYSAGTFTHDDTGYHFTGLKQDSLNVYFSTTTGTSHAGTSFNTPSGDVAIVDPTHLEALSTNLMFPLGTNTLEHELAHQFLGHPTSSKSYAQGESEADWTVYKQGVWGRPVPAFRQGLEPRQFAVPANPEANKPRQ